jgi:hypothetical protein
MSACSTGRAVTVETADTTWRIYHGDELLTEVARTTTGTISRFKVRKPEPPRHNARMSPTPPMTRAEPLS